MGITKRPKTNINTGNAVSEALHTFSRPASFRRPLRSWPSSPRPSPSNAIEKKEAGDGGDKIMLWKIQTLWVVAARANTRGQETCGTAVTRGTRKSGRKKIKLDGVGFHSSWRRSIDMYRCTAELNTTHKGRV